MTGDRAYDDGSGCVMGTLRVYQEEGGYEYVANENKGAQGKEELHLEPAVLYQPLGGEATAGGDADSAGRLGAIPLCKTGVAGPCAQDIRVVCNDSGKCHGSTGSHGGRGGSRGGGGGNPVSTEDVVCTAASVVGGAIGAPGGPEGRRCGERRRRPSMYGGVLTCVPSESSRLSACK